VSLSLGSAARIPLAISIALFGCRQNAPARGAGDTGSSIARTDTTAAARTQCGDDARHAVEQLGSRLRRVSLLAPHAVAARSIAEAYGDLVMPKLLAAWQQAPASAPGRETSNPWPARVVVDSIEPKGTECRVDAQVLFVTTDDTTRAVERRPVVATVEDSAGWRVSSWTSAGASASPPTTPNSSGDTAGATAVLRRYFNLIATHQYDSAYALWSGAGRASDQSPVEFATGYRETAALRATIGSDVRVEGAAGSQYATVPVVIDATLRNGRRQHFEGTYTVRRSMVDGASAEQRSWRIYTAAMHEK
jgi:hypothetical protein